jgi:hypothetical protein
VPAISAVVGNGNFILRIVEVIEKLKRNQHPDKPNTA